MTEPITRLHVGMESPLGVVLEVGKEVKPGLSVDGQVGGVSGAVLGAGVGATYRFGDPIRTMVKPTISVRARVLGIEGDKGLDGGFAVGVRAGVTIEQDMLSASLHAGVGRMIGIEDVKNYPEVGVMMGFRF